MNPEFRRQLWLQFSATRLALLPLLLAGIFFAVYLSAKAAPAEPLAAAAALLFGVLVWGMGTFAAGSSVMDEIADRTWDQQRMSAMQPWTMTWGKLAGASAYGWYGGALCLLVALPSALAQEPIAWVLKVAAMAVLAGIFLQALLIAINLQLLKSGSRVSRRGGVWALLLVLLWGSGMVMGALRGTRIDWWGQTFERLDFALASLALFTACALLGAWRSMAEVLAVRQLPWAWPTMALAATAYVSGFAGGAAPARGRRGGAERVCSIDLFRPAGRAANPAPVAKGGQPGQHIAVAGPATAAAALDNHAGIGSAICSDHRPVAGYPGSRAVGAVKRGTVATCSICIADGARLRIGPVFGVFAQQPTPRLGLCGAHAGAVRTAALAIAINRRPSAGRRGSTPVGPQCSNSGNGDRASGPGTVVVALALAGNYTWQQSGPLER